MRTVLLAVGRKRKQTNETNAQKKMIYNLVFRLNKIKTNFLNFCRKIGIDVMVFKLRKKNAKKNIFY